MTEQDGLNGLETLAFRRLISRLADEDDHEDLDPIERVDRAIDRVENLETENEQLKERVAELEGNVNPDPTNKEYDDLTRDEKVRKVRETLLSEAQQRRNGKAKMDYKGVLLLFDNRPSAGHVYQLMEIAAEEEGFDYVDADGKAIRVNSNAVKDDGLFHAVNKTRKAETA